MASAIALPLAGVYLAGLPVERYLEFPPRARYVAHAPFSLLAFILFGLGICALLPWYFYGLAGMERNPLGALSLRRAVPAAALLALAWALAWSRLAAFAWLQHHTFVIVWGAYIYFVHTLLAGFGASPFTGNAKRAGGLILASACFWWLFEWLNRFVQNWTYHEVDHFSPFEYWLFATMSFATVLPAVLVTKSLLETLFTPRVETQKLALHPASFLGPLWIAGLAVALGTLVLLPKFPNLLFPFLWLSPLLLLIILCRLFQVRTFIEMDDEGDLAQLVFWSIAGICCGVLWEIWNFYSLAGWDYHIPYVGKPQIFEMPVLGFAGYLPFGVLCGLMCSLFMPSDVPHQDARSIMRK